MGTDIQLSAEQRAALKVLRSGVNVFLTGKAGTGKSTVIQEYRKTTSKPTLYVAPTGIAALNIKGQTIHSCFQIPPGKMSDIGPIQSRRRFDILRNAEVVVVDEISMVRSDLLTAIDVRLREVARGSNSTKPFGGKQLIVVGDFHQLPPVVDNDNLYTYLAMRYGGVYAFQTDVWMAANFSVVNLQNVYRQSDTKFIELLNAVRIADAGALIELNTRVMDCPEDTSRVILSPYRATVDRINKAELDAIDAPTFTYTGILEGRFTKDLPVDQELTLKTGARVMIAANKATSDGTIIYSNGELATVSSLSATAITVRTDSGRILTLHPHQWDMYEYDYSGSKVEAKPVGTYTQFPLRLAWAVTIHKSQGCTFDNVVLDLGRGCFAPGQLYTALSRIRSFEGLYLTRNIKETDIHVDLDVLKFYED